MSAHSFPNNPMRVVVFGGPNRFENYCQCGYRAHAPGKEGMPAAQADHLVVAEPTVIEIHNYGMIQADFHDGKTYVLYEIDSDE